MQIPFLTPLCYSALFCCKFSCYSRSIITKNFFVSLLRLFCCEKFVCPSLLQLCAKMYTLCIDMIACVFFKVFGFNTVIILVVFFVQMFSYKRNYYVLCISRIMHFLDYAFVLCVCFMHFTSQYCVASVAANLKEIRCSVCHVTIE